MLVRVRANVAGVVWKIAAAQGDAVSAGQTVVILESMKMEIPVASPSAGRVARVLVAPGDAVDEDAVLLELA